MVNGKFMHIIRPGYGFADLALCIVVAAEDVNRNVGCGQAAKLGGCPQAGLHVLPPPVEKIAGKDYKIHTLIYC